MSGVWQGLCSGFLYVQHQGEAPDKADIVLIWVASLHQNAHSRTPQGVRLCARYGPPRRGKLCIACPDFFQTSGRTHSTALLSPVWRARRSNFTILIQTRIIRTRFRSKMDPDDALFIRNTAAGHSAPPSQHQQPQDKIKPINTTSAGPAVLSARPPSPQQNLPAPA